MKKKLRVWRVMYGRGTALFFDGRKDVGIYPASFIDPQVGDAVERSAEALQ
jgi:hypothetical protein